MLSVTSWIRITGGWCASSGRQPVLIGEIFFDGVVPHDQTRHCFTRPDLAMAKVGCPGNGCMGDVCLGDRFPGDGCRGNVCSGNGGVCQRKN
jgi:hypothetical protein